MYDRFWLRWEFGLGVWMVRSMAMGLWERAGEMQGFARQAIGSNCSFFIFELHIYEVAR